MMALYLTLCLVSMYYNVDETTSVVRAVCRTIHAIQQETGHYERLLQKWCAIRVPHDELVEYLLHDLRATYDWLTRYIQT